MSGCGARVSITFRMNNYPITRDRPSASSPVGQILKLHKHIVMVISLRTQGTRVFIKESKEASLNQ